MKTTKTVKTLNRARLAKAGYDFYKGTWTKTIEVTNPVAKKDYPGVPAGTKHTKTSVRTIEDASGERNTIHFRRA